MIYVLEADIALGEEYLLQKFFPNEFLYRGYLDELTRHRICSFKRKKFSYFVVCFMRIFTLVYERVFHLNSRLS